MTKKVETRLTDRKREAILLAAVGEFQKLGFGGTSMDRIAEAADVSKRTVYNHFRSKDDLCQAIISELLKRTAQMPKHTYSPDIPLENQLHKIGKSFAEVLTNEYFMKLTRVVVSRAIQHPEFANSILEEQAKFSQSLVDWVAAARKDGRLSVSSPQKAATQFRSLIKAFAFWPQLLGTGKPLSKRELSQVTKSAVSMFLDHYQK